MSVYKYSAAELVQLNTLSLPNCLKVIRSFCLLRRPRYVHRAVRHKFVYMDTTPAVSAVRYALQRQRFQNKPRPRAVNLGSLLSINCGVTPVAASTNRDATFMLLNTRSLNNKALLMYDIIQDKKIDFLCLTETWQSQQDFLTLNQATPPDYAYIQKPRSLGRGGGLAVIHRSNIQVKEFPVTSTSFECLHFALAGTAQLQVLLIYRPPKASTHFLSELAGLLATICPMYPSTILLGDFNIHVDSASCSFASDFMTLLDCFSITQHVIGPTHTKGHTLDLVCSTGTTPGHLQCEDLAISDHFAISFSVSVPAPRLPSKRTITFRKTKQVHTSVLSTALATHLATPPPNTTVDGLVELYNTALSLSLDSVAPPITRQVSLSRPAPWFTPELRLMKAAGRQLERRYRKSGLTVHQEAYKDHVREYKEALSKARILYYSKLINNQQNHPKKLFSTINRLLRPPDAPQPSDALDLCSRFLEFFHNKVETIHNHLLQHSPSPSHTDLHLGADTLQCGLSAFATLDANQVHDLVSRAKSSSCKLDPMPTFLVKTCLPVICPFITAIINCSLGSGVVPAGFKTAAVIPTLKKPGLDPDDPNNYRPISNLPFLSKILERAVASQLQHHMAHHELFEPLQSGFRIHHSTETALIKITNDLLTAADNGLISILILLDLSAAFDTVSHSILLTRLAELIGLSGSALSWFQSYLANRQQYVTLDDATSTTAPVNHGVPQGSVLGPLLFTIYMLPLGQIIRHHGLSFHCYADDTQLYISTKPSTQFPPAPLINCLQDLKIWMTSNLLKLNSNKTELLVVAPKSLLRKVGDLLLEVDGCPITPSPVVRNLGVILDPTLSFQPHINNTTKSAFFHLRNIARLRPSLSDSVTETLIHCFISTRLDYCNSILTGLPSKTLDRLQYVQNSAARVLTGTKPWQHITPILMQLHWLPVKSRIKFKILLLTYKSLHALAPRYLSDLLHPYTPLRSLRSSAKDQLETPRTRLKTFGDRAFCASAPTLWNLLPLHIRCATSVESFKKLLKAHLFLEAYGL